MFADLHMHSIYSDGSDSPGQLISIAKDNNIGVVALTDHDTVDGIKELLSEAIEFNIIGVPGVEISTSVNKVRVHILGYYIDINNSHLLSYLDALSKARTQNTRQVFDNLCEMKWIEYSWDRVLQHNKGKSWLCSLHVFNSMKEDQYLPSTMRWEEFYYKNFCKDSPAYVDLSGFFPEDAIDIIKKAGGIPVVAHPKLIGNDEHVKNLIKYGVKGIEVYYPAHSENEVNKYLGLAEQYDLYVTGGTDWHGTHTEWNVKLGECGINKNLFKKISKVKLHNIR